MSGGWSKSRTHYYGYKFRMSPSPKKEPEYWLGHSRYPNDGKLVLGLYRDGDEDRAWSMNGDVSAEQAARDIFERVGPSGTPTA